MIGLSTDGRCLAATDLLYGRSNLLRPPDNGGQRHWETDLEAAPGVRLAEPDGFVSLGEVAAVAVGKADETFSREVAAGDPDLGSPPGLWRRDGDCSLGHRERRLPQGVVPADHADFVVAGPGAHGYGDRNGHVTIGAHLKP